VLARFVLGQDILRGGTCGGVLAVGDTWGDGEVEGCWVKGWEIGARGEKDGYLRFGRDADRCVEAGCG
jgi:hypothetical protein